MTEQPDPVLVEAARWLTWAEEDLTLAQHTAADPDVVRRGACTWAHQAAEKALKALLVAEGTDPPKIHDLVRLARMLSDATQASLADFDLVGLTRWAIEGRYPSDVEEATAADLDAALDAAESTVSVALDALTALRVARLVEASSPEASARGDEPSTAAPEG